MVIPYLYFNVIVVFRFCTSMFTRSNSQLMIYQSTIKMTIWIQLRQSQFLHNCMNDYAACELHRQGIKLQSSFMQEYDINRQCGKVCPLRWIILSGQNKLFVPVFCRMIFSCSLASCFCCIRKAIFSSTSMVKSCAQLILTPNLFTSLLFFHVDQRPVYECDSQSIIDSARACLTISQHSTVLAFMHPNK